MFSGSVLRMRPQRLIYRIRAIIGKKFWDKALPSFVKIAVILPQRPGLVNQKASLPEVPFPVSWQKSAGRQSFLRPPALPPVADFKRAAPQLSMCLPRKAAMDWASLYSTSPPLSSSWGDVNTTLPNTSPSDRMGATVSR